MKPKKPLHSIFTDVPPRYDLINRLFTWGLDRRWRRCAALECLKTRPARILDLCCGTADLAIKMAKQSSETEVFALDYSQPMLEVAREKARKAKVGTIHFVYGDASSLPFPDGYFDCVGISFAFRNLTYKNPLTAGYLAEVLRVLRPGGRFIIIESSQPKSVWVRRLYHLYLRLFVARLGQAISGHKGAYAYLAESAAAFYTAEQVCGLLLKAGFSQVSFRRLFPGAVALHVAIKGEKENPSQSPFTKGRANR